MGRYSCIFNTGERADSQPLYEEFLAVCVDDLETAYEGQDAWTGVRVYDQVGVDRLAELPRLSAFLDSIGRQNITMVNYYNMAPRSVQHAHRDQSGNLLFGISRLHLPLRTNPEAYLEVEKQRYHLPLDEIWALDTSGLHSAQNGGDEGRVHLVVDVKRSPETAKYFPQTSMAVRLHLVKFVALMGVMVARDLVTKPKTVVGRLPYLWGMFRSRFRRGGVSASGA